MLKKISKDIESNFKVYILLFLIGIGSRIPFLEKYQSHWDGPDWSIALVNYSFANKTPTEPGYPLYIFIGRVFNFFINDLHLSVLAVSVFFAGVGAVVAYVVGRTFFGKRAGAISSILFLTSPTMYYFGITANPYGILFTTASFIVLAIYKIFIEKVSSASLLAVALSFGIGVRPQDILFFIPLSLLGFLLLHTQEKLKFVLLFCCLCLAWIIPTSFAVGGLDVYLGYIVPFFQQGPGLNLSISRLTTILPTIVKGFYLTFTVSSLALIYYIKPVSRIPREFRISLNNQNRMILLFTLWIVPSFVFNLFVRSDHAAHQMAYLSAFLYVIAYSVSKIALSKRNFIFFILLITIFNLITFFRIRDSMQLGPYVSQSYHYSEIVKNNIRMPATIKYVEKFDNQNTIVIVDSEIFRPVSYYLTEYRVYAFSALDSVVQSNPKYIHFSYRWLYKGESDEKEVFEIPQNTKTVILIPNNRDFSIDGARYKKVRLSGNVLIDEIAISNQDLIRFSFRSLKFD